VKENLGPAHILGAMAPMPRTETPLASIQWFWGQKETGEWKLNSRYSDGAWMANWQLAVSVYLTEISPETGTVLHTRINKNSCQMRLQTCPWSSFFFPQNSV